MINDLETKLKTVSAELYPQLTDVKFDVEITESQFGDFASNIALKLAKELQSNPREIAAKLIEKLSIDKTFASIEAAGPGFINMRLSDAFWSDYILQIVKNPANYGSTNIGEGKRVDIEFISANPTGPLTIGNSRGGVIGDVLSNVMQKNGYNVTREYYFNDAGGQIDVLGHSVLGDEQAQYKGEYIEELRKEIQTDDYREAGRIAAQKLIEKIKQTAAGMGIKFDIWFAEGKDLREKGKIEEILQWLKSKDLTYEKEGAIWFKSTQFGDDKDRVLVRSNGEPTYFCVDCAYHKNKFVDRKFDKVINVWGADHHGDVARVRGFVTALGFVDKFEIILNQFVRVVIDGKEVRMSKRAGTYVLVDDLLDEVGKDVYRFFMLEYAPSSHLNFDLALAKERSEKNPVYYVQYAHARICSILNKANEQGIDNTDADLTLLDNPAEKELKKQLAQYPIIVANIAQDYQVQRLPFFAIELAKKFHVFYENCSIINAETPQLKKARYALLKATQIVLANTLALMGIDAPEKM